jgi:DNA-binding transcriptional regulator YhcF (GntR family)
MWLLRSAAWLSLTAAERAVYVQLASRYNGSNNGKIAFSVRDAAKECRLSKDTAARAFKALESTGFVEIKTPGGFSRKVRHAAEWLLTEFRDDVSGELPKKTFMRWAKSQNTVPT